MKVIIHCWKKIAVISTAFLLFAASFSFAQQLANPVLIKQLYAEKYEKCPSSKDTYFVIYKNPNPFPIDIVIAIQRIDGEWVCFNKNFIATGDTISGYVCDGKGKHKIDFKKSKDTLTLFSCEKLNVEFYIKHPEKISVAVQPQVTEYQNSQPFDINAKILFGEPDKKPLANQKVALKDVKGDVLQSTITDKYGDFSFKQISKQKNLEIFLENSSTIPKNEKIFLAKQNGIVISEMQKDVYNNFSIRLLPPDIIKLSTVEEEDPFLAVINFGKSGDKNLVVADNIYYSPGSTELLPEAQLKLNKVINVLKENTSLSVELSSHTDAIGDDMSNLKLSQERVKIAVAYIISKGIPVNRVKGKGYGETQILNRCKNGIDCSEKENQANRRTEFKFIKN